MIKAEGEDEQATEAGAEGEGVKVDGGKDQGGTATADDLRAFHHNGQANRLIYIAEQMVARVRNKFANNKAENTMQTYSKKAKQMQKGRTKGTGKLKDTSGHEVDRVSYAEATQPCQRKLPEH